MALNYPDILQHNNSNYALLDVSQLRGNAYVIGSLIQTGSIPEDKRNPGSIIFATGSQQFYGFYGTSSADWNITTNWKLLSSGGGGGGTAFNSTIQANSTTSLFTVDPQLYRGIYVDYLLQYNKSDEVLAVKFPSRTGRIQVTIPYDYTNEQIYYTEQILERNPSIHSVDKNDHVLPGITTEQAIIGFEYIVNTQLINAFLGNYNSDYTVSIKGEYKTIAKI